MSAQHTSGPLLGLFFNGAQIRLPKSGHVADSPGAPGSTVIARLEGIDEAKVFAATGRAMAAAPELLAAARVLAARGFFTPTSCADAATLKDMAAMRAAIAKATGRAS